MLLQIWRKESFDNYGKVEDIELPSMCDGGLKILEPREECRMRPNCVNIYKCTLKKGVNITVEAEDILGITLPPQNRSRFVLSFKKSKVANYIFERDPLSTINLSNYTNKTAVHVQPLIVVEVATGQGNYSYWCSISRTSVTAHFSHYYYMIVVVLSLSNAVNVYYVEDEPSTTPTSAMPLTEPDMDVDGKSHQAAAHC
jgi:hypothetical protein